MKNILISVLIASIVVIISYFLSKDMNGATPLYIFIISINFGIIAGLLTHDYLWAKKYDVKPLQRGIKVGLISAIGVVVIGITASLGVESIDELIKKDKTLFKILILSTGWVGFTLGGLKKYLLFKETVKTDNS